MTPRWLIIWLVVVMSGCMLEDIYVNPGLPRLDIIEADNSQSQNPIKLVDGQIEVVHDKQLGISFVVPEILTALHLGDLEEESRWVIKVQYEQKDNYLPEFYQLEPEVLMMVHDLTTVAKAVDFVANSCEESEFKRVQGKVFKVCVHPGLVSQMAWYYQEDAFVYIIMMKSYPTAFNDLEIKQQVDDAIEELLFSVNINCQPEGGEK